LGSDVPRKGRGKKNSTTTIVPKGGLNTSERKNKEMHHTRSLKKR